MSSGQTPRTREHFPHMKVRGGRRRHHRRPGQTQPHRDATKRLADLCAGIVEAFRPAATAFGRFVEALHSTPLPISADDYVLGAESARD